MRQWERRARLKIEESAEVRRFVEAQARESEAEATLRRAQAHLITVEASVKQIDRENSAIDNFHMEVNHRKVEQAEIDS